METGSGIALSVTWQLRCAPIPGVGLVHPAPMRTCPSSTIRSVLGPWILRPGRAGAKATRHQPARIRYRP